MASWRTAWQSLRKAADLSHVRFHDGRHTALTRLAEKGLPDWVIRAQFGHVSPAMMAVYSHVRRKALDEAAKALEPDATGRRQEVTTEAPVHDQRVTSQVTSQPTSARRNVIEFPRNSGSSGWARTSNPPVNSHIFQRHSGRLEATKAVFPG